MPDEVEEPGGGERYLRGIGERRDLVGLALGFGACGATQTPCAVLCCGRGFATRCEGTPPALAGSRWVSNCNERLGRNLPQATAPSFSSS